MCLDYRKLLLKLPMAKNLNRSIMTMLSKANLPAPANVILLLIGFLFIILNTIFLC